MDGALKPFRIYRMVVSIYEDLCGPWIHRADSLREINEGERLDGSRD